MKKGVLFIMCVIFVLFSAFIRAETIRNYVVDNAGVFSVEQKSSFETRLMELQGKTNNVQLVVYTENKIPPDSSLEERSLKLAEENKVGKKGADNGILFYLAVEDRAYRWEVGYGVEDVLNTPLLGRVSREMMEPNFKKGDFSGGIINGVDVVERILMNSSDEDVQRLMNNSANQDPTGLIIFSIIFFIIIISIIISSIKYQSKKGIKHKGSLNDAIYFGAMWGMFGPGRGKGGFGGGSFGGFGGMGGGFGGGGFSGHF
ncbi:MAG: TPM domain-containing protein [Candidatus Woesearchaeota archaeon]